MSKSAQAEARFCVVCCRHHEQGRSHIFTTKHKTRLSTILTKFSKKVRCARQQLQKPGVMDGELEPDSMLWCYFCEMEVTRHITDRITTIVWGGLLEHMASPLHHRKTRHFWWVNGADSKLLQNFLLFEAEYIRYKELVAAALHHLESKKELKLKEELKAKEASQLLVTWEPPAPQTPPTTVYSTVQNKYGVLQNPTGWHEGRRVWGGGIVIYRVGSDQLLPWAIDSLHSNTHNPSNTESGGRGVVTVAATGAHLTAIKPPSLDKGEGNVHSGATPPWLREDDNEGGAPAQIGPSEEEFLRHKESSSNSVSSRKNPRRVGADFHLRLKSSLETGHGEWFPSFGRVWNSGPRSHSLAEFYREKRVPTSSKPASIIKKEPHRTITDMPGPSGLGSHHLQSTTHSVPGKGGDSPSTLLETRNLPNDVLLGEIRPYVRKRRRKPDTGNN